jgi:GxxExxY protein
MLRRNASAVAPEIEDIVHRTIGCALTVHKELGAGFLESIYHKALRLELQHQQQYEHERVVQVVYRSKVLHGHRIDLIVERCVVVEVKAVERLDRVHVSQVLSYLKATNLRIGLLINFKTDWLKGGIRRVIL